MDVDPNNQPAQTTPPPEPAPEAPVEEKPEELLEATASPDAPLVDAGTLPTEAAETPVVPVEHPFDPPATRKSNKTALIIVVVAAALLIAAAAYALFRPGEEGARTANTATTATPTAVTPTAPLTPTQQASALMTNNSTAESSIVGTDDSSQATAASTDAGTVGDSVDENKF